MPPSNVQDRAAMQAAFAALAAPAAHAQARREHGLLLAAPAPVVKCGMGKGEDDEKCLNDSHPVMCAPRASTYACVVLLLC